MAEFKGKINHTVSNSDISKFDNGHWCFNRQMNVGNKKYVGFIYIIYDTVLDRFYLGKKNYRSYGKATYGQESDWRRYKSSSNSLAAHFASRPKKEFKFIVLDEYTTKGSLAWAETWSLCHVETPVTLKWYNKQIEKVSWDVKENVSHDHRVRLTMITKMVPECLMQWPKDG
jgi:hypothetical protein